MNIKNLTIDPVTVLAPLAGITNLPFRRIVKAAGCGLVCSEMISANGLAYGAHKTRAMLASCPEEKPLSVQIFGADPDIMAEAGKIVEASGADILDVNFGCAVKKILKSGAGAALMKTPETAKAILTRLRAAVQIPLTIKIRSGWDASGEEALLIAKIAQDCGVDAIAVHPRTATQRFSGKADWALIARIKQMLEIPVMGNGDIETPFDALRMIEETKCDAVMIGRAALHNPWIFSQIHSLVKHGEIPRISLARRFATIKEYAAASVDLLGELTACRMMRSRLTWFVKGLPESSRFRKSITRIRTRMEAEALIDAYFDFLEERMEGQNLKTEAGGNSSMGS